MMFSRKTLALIFTFVIVLTALFILSLSTTSPLPPNTQLAMSVTPTPVAQTMISLMPNPLELSQTKEGMAEVKIDTQNNEVISAQIEISYDPSVITVTSIKPGSLFRSIPQFTTIDKKEGRISYGLGITPAQAPIKGTGTIATITFTKNPTTTKTSTQLKLLPTTLISAKGIGPSVLSKATGTTIQLTTTQ